MPFWDGEEWHLWVPAGDRGLMHLRPADAAHIDYVAKEPASQSDLLIPFVDFMWQHAAWPDVYPTISAIIDDFHNLATSVAKIDHFFEVRETLGIGGKAFVATELEYLFVLSRSVFDLLQFAIASIWDKHIQLVDDEANRRKRRPKESFTKVVLKERKQPRTQAELMTANGFTPALASTYEKVAPFFIQILNARDGIIHGNKSAGSLTPVYDTERGWCVHRIAKGISEFSVWNDEHRYNDNLVSLRPLLAHVVFGTISACGELVTSLARDINSLLRSLLDTESSFEGFTTRRLSDCRRFTKAEALGGRTKKRQPIRPAKPDERPGCRLRHWQGRRLRGGGGLPSRSAA